MGLEHPWILIPMVGPGINSLQIVDGGQGDFIFFPQTKIKAM